MKTYEQMKEQTALLHLLVAQDKNNADLLWALIVAILLLALAITLWAMCLVFVGKLIRINTSVLNIIINFFDQCLPESEKMIKSSFLKAQKAKTDH